MHKPSIKGLCLASSTRISTWHCPHLLLDAVLRRRCCWAPAPAALDRYVLPTVRSAANPPHSTAAVKRWDRQTDGQTPYRYIDPAPHTMREVPINIVNILEQADTFLRILVRVFLK